MRCEFVSRCLPLVVVWNMSGSCMLLSMRPNGTIRKTLLNLAHCNMHAHIFVHVCAFVCQHPGVSLIHVSRCLISGPSLSHCHWKHWCTLFVRAIGFLALAPVGHGTGDRQVELVYSGSEVLSVPRAWVRKPNPHMAVNAGIAFACLHDTRAHAE